MAARPFARDTTAYSHTAGSARTSPTAYYAHHLAAIPASIVTADALVVLEGAAYLAQAANSASGRP